MREPNILMVRSCESHGRPEKIIADQLVAAFAQANPDANLMVETVDQVSPVNGASFYSTVGVVKKQQAFLELVSGLAHSDVRLDAVLFVDAAGPEPFIFDYLWRLAGRTVPKYFGILHSSTNISADLFSASPLMNGWEDGIIEGFEKIFVASNYMHDLLVKHKIEEARSVYDDFHVEYFRNKVQVTGLPYPQDMLPAFPVPNFNALRAQPATDVSGNYHVLKLAWNHRLADDKGWDTFVAVCTRLNELLASATENALVQPIIYTPVDIDPLKTQLLDNSLHLAPKIVVSDSREQYVRNLRSDAIFLSFAELETFGYSMLEAAMCGAVILAPDRAPYNELYDEAYLFEPGRSTDATVKAIMQAIIQLRGLDNLPPTILPEANMRIIYACDAMAKTVLESCSNA